MLRACLCRAEVGRYVGRYATDSNHLLEMFDDKGEEKIPVWLEGTVTEKVLKVS